MIILSSDYASLSQLPNSNEDLIPQPTVPCLSSC